jgi:hypothetical protein
LLGQENMAMKRSRVLLLSMLLASGSFLAGCHHDGPIIDYACGPWMDVATDVPIGPLGLSVSDALAKLKPSYLLEGPPAGDASAPGSRGRLVVEVATQALQAGPVKAQASNSEYPGAPTGQCGIKVALSAHVRSTDGIIDAQTPEVLLGLYGEADTTFKADLSGTLPPPYPAPKGLSVEIRIELASSDATADLRSVDDSTAWTWSGHAGAP